MIYLDTSAFIKLYIRESESETLQSFITAQDHPLPVWDMLEAEFCNALRLKIFWGDLTEAQAAGQIEHYERRKHAGQYYVPEVSRAALMTAFHALSRETARLGCRTMDILHVAFALQIEPQTFVTYDARQRALAEHAGLNVWPVGVE